MSNTGREKAVAATKTQEAQKVEGSLGIAFQSTIVHYQGGLSPQTLMQYEQIDPGRAKKLLDMAEEQQRHRIEMERAVLLSDISRSQSGSKAAYILLFCMMLLTAYGYSRGEFAYTSGAIVAVMIAYTGSYSFGLWTRHIERERKLPESMTAQTRK